MFRPIYRQRAPGWTRPFCQQSHETAIEVTSTAKQKLLDSRMSHEDCTCDGGVY